ncbi:hypothetical protein GRI43_01070 [Altererythrobacter luteolus]|uniref:Uncharacterized protein n=1 Tax=Pontixanthobacter luteolus TaxID=295089 RepID=A0A6I4UWQ3_9SPHN|nr:hypothetical protein [Pontixanthobacter luteolus]MXP45983.1 hypothetical protein [Pontixanthobacter luteolus]
MLAEATVVPHLPWIIGAALAIGAAGVAGWIHTTKLKIKHGYPLEGMWGQSLKPSTDGQTAQRVTLLTQENAEMRAELSAVKDRLANVERIVTDSGFSVSNEIERLRDQSSSGAGVPLSDRKAEVHG